MVSSHVYQFDDLLCWQSVEGPTGDKLIAIIAQILMLRFTNDYISKPKEVEAFNRVRLLKVLMTWMWQCLDFCGDTKWLNVHLY